MKNKTTVVILNYNGNKWLKPLLDSLKKEDCGVFVVDNGSTDGTASLCDSQLGMNWGYANGNNFGAAMANSENVLFMNNDMFPLTKGFVKKMEDRCNFEYSIVGAKLIFGETKTLDVHGAQFNTYEGKVQHAGIGITPRYEPTEIGRGKDPSDPIVNKAGPVPGITGACMMIKKELFVRLRGFNNSFFNGFEDVDLCWRAREIGHKCWYEPTVELLHYCSSSKGRFDFEKENKNLLLKLWTPDRVKKIL